MGKPIFLKKLVPNKTLEGLIGGFFGSLLFILLCALVTDLNFKVSTVLLFGCVFAFLGDLLISYFKRQSGVKDTGSILPGHGGVLDRIDSHLIAAPGIIIIIQLYAGLIILI
jgi:phosphatidate cytidylyltransferase